MVDFDVRAKERVETMTVRQKTVRNSITEAEWQARCDLAALYRMLDLLGWTDLIYGHASARIPGEPNHFLINAFGQTCNEITASSLVKMDMDGTTLTPGGHTNEAGYIIHSGVYKSRPDANCAIHTHTRNGSGLSLIANGIRPISQPAMHVIDDLAYHAYGIPASTEECEALGHACEKASLIVLLNHGLLTHAPTIKGALLRLYMLEEACELEVMARMMNADPVPIEDYVQKAATKWMQGRRNTAEYGAMEWDAWLRAINGRGTDYRR